MVKEKSAGGRPVDKLPFQPWDPGWLQSHWLADAANGRATGRYSRRHGHRRRHWHRHWHWIAERTTQAEGTERTENAERTEAEAAAQAKAETAAKPEATETET